MDDLLKEAIADAKAVRETALENAKIALEEAFTPRLQSMLSKKIQSEIEAEGMHDEEEDDEPEEGMHDEDDDMEEKVEDKKIAKDQQFKMDMSNVKHFSQRDFMDALETIGFFQA